MQDIIIIFNIPVTLEICSVKNTLERNVQISHSWLFINFLLSLLLLPRAKSVSCEQVGICFGLVSSKSNCNNVSFLRAYGRFIRLLSSFLAPYNLVVLYLQLHYTTENVFCLLRVCYKTRFACVLIFTKLVSRVFRLVQITISYN